ncbi:N-6 adenine-specific DNA methylase [Streptococcus pneumoniae]|nr:N-6 adenine-specific DNA methylase [Streptococcus pneumoniae]
MRFLTFFFLTISSFFTHEYPFLFYLLPFAPLKIWSKFILTSDEAFESKYGSQADKKRKLYNGTLKVDLYQYFGQRVKRQEVK